MQMKEPVVLPLMWNQTDLGYRKAVKLSLKNFSLFCLPIHEVTCHIFLLSEKHCPKICACGILPYREQEMG